MSLFGRAVLLLALATAVFTVGAALIGRAPGRRAWFLAARRGMYALLGLFAVAVGTLQVALLRGDFALANVAGYSSREIQWYFKITALWASQAGSLMFWALILTFFSAIAVYTNRNRNHDLMPVVVAILGGLVGFFALVLSFGTSPFATVDVVPDNGSGLVSALRNPYMITHPPMLYLGYVMVAIPFAFAMAALVTRRLDTGWLTSMRKWNLASWTFLGIGIILGAKWAYESLTFGGYWIWDPVENAALLPWLTGTAYIHSVMVQERRGMLKVWNMVLILVTFALTIFGTFMTRSGITSSVHAFGARTVGPYLLGLLIVTLVGGMYLIISRLSYLKSSHSIESYFSREAIFLYNNLLLVGLAFIVTWGTLYPAMTELFTGERITVGTPFFDQVAAPVGIALLILTGIGPLIPWRKASPKQLRQRFLWPTIVGLVSLPLFLLTDARGSWPVVVTLVFAVFTTVCIVLEFWRGMKVRHAQGGVTWLASLGQIIGKNRRRYGGYIVHLGIVVVICGIAVSKAFVTEGQFQLRQGERATLGGYTFTATSLTRGRTAQAMRVEAAVDVTNASGGHVGTLRPAMNVFTSNRDMGVEVAILGGPKRDIWMYMPSIKDGVAPFKVFVNPMVSWIWTGGLIFLIGSVVAGWPQGKRRRVPQPEPVAEAQHATA